MFDNPGKRIQSYAKIFFVASILSEGVIGAVAGGEEHRLLGIIIGILVGAVVNYAFCLFMCAFGELVENVSAIWRKICSDSKEQVEISYGICSNCGGSLTPSGKCSICKKQNEI